VNAFAYLVLAGMLGFWLGAKLQLRQCRAQMLEHQRNLTAFLDGSAQEADSDAREAHRFEMEEDRLIALGRGYAARDIKSEVESYCAEW